MNTTQNTALNLSQVAQAIRLTRKTLDAGTDHLPYDITERLRAARVQALAGISRKPVAVQEKHLTDGLLGWLQRMPVLAKALFAVPALCLAIIAIQTTKENNVSTPMALTASIANTNAVNDANAVNALNIDAILKEQVPLQAYLDADFNHFIEQDKQDAQAPVKVNSPQSKGISSHVQKNTLVQALR